MWQSLLRIGSALLLSVTVAAAIAIAIAFDYSGFANDGLSPLARLLSALPKFAAVAIPVALPFVLLGEARRVKGLPYWISGALIVAFAGLGWRVASTDMPLTLRTVAATVLIGCAGGTIYWRVAGHKAGRLMANFEASPRQRFDDRRCALCTTGTLAVLALPVLLIAYVTTLMPGPQLPDDIVRQAEADAKRKLEAAGLTELSLQIVGSVGNVTGALEGGKQRDRAYTVALHALSPLVGPGGVVARLENKIVTADAVGGGS